MRGPGMRALGRASAAAMKLKQTAPRALAQACALPIAVLAVACASRPAPPEPEPVVASSPRVPVEPETTAQDDEAARWAEAVREEDEHLRAQLPDATVRIAVLDVATGRVLARRGPVELEHATGSTMKSLTVAATLAEGATADTEVDCSAPVKVAGREVSDHAVHGKITVKEALARSSNVAIAQLAAKLGWRPLYDRVAKLVPLPDPAGLGEAEAVALLFGGTSRLTTLDLLHAYAILAGGGRDPIDGSQRVEEGVAAAVMAMLEHAVTGEHGTGREAAVAGVPIAGKTGTARAGEQQTALFVGIVGPSGDRRVVAVVLENVGPDVMGSTAAAPAFARIVRRMHAPGRGALRSRAAAPTTRACRRSAASSHPRMGS
jgi:membrane peptidoglycan carboxypeptidase